MESRNTTNPENEMQTGTEIYYTGDMANHEGSFKVVAVNGYNVKLQEMDGEFSQNRSFSVYASEIGNKYHGHCNPRFVTRDARNAYRDAILSK